MDPHRIRTVELRSGVRAGHDWRRVSRRRTVRVREGPRRPGCLMLADEFLPVFDVSDEVAVVVNADAATTWQTLMNTDLIQVGQRRPLVGVLGALRALPEVASHLLHGEHPPNAPDRLTLRGTTEIPANRGGWILLAERPGEEIALGMLGKFWRPVIEYAHTEPEDFTAFDVPGFAKTVYALSVRPIDDHRTLLRGVMRTEGTDEPARRWFRRYWMLGVGSGAHALVNGLLDVVREDAETIASALSGGGHAVR
jgi:hypothetical protein